MHLKALLAACLGLSCEAFTIIRVGGPGTLRLRGVGGRRGLLETLEAVESVMDSPSVLSAGKADFDPNKGVRNIPDDQIITLRKPAGIKWSQDEAGNIYVGKMEPDCSAARTGLVKQGDKLLFMSAAWGNDMWSCKGSSVDFVAQAEFQRAAPDLRIVLERGGKIVTKPKAQGKKSDAELLAEMDKDEEERPKWLGIF
uniref:PDZ domain-containing protein n=1 Tax=Chromera velia CCMP2878 TaxID=1169474 RepID=A0A0G4GQP7_9ALVE|mmetsp:Transcript_19531/g.39323  ORF Transcript_19531/g.39323 Transcript_19531/m.39323 type:complete len:198 (-) Transcript_19531:1229-1822(-)|eukprot:Cvel_22898.t1-p1 / transcript=Cvel_22898.t1 / gene=Cvel_22898 / organism=Chromera_velia_CCMP2878 / gene_product=hypothetical protein / transcript_product=hypothetical protein / location=Cvel_scaffold2300:22198-24776(+) / protein_length=197 / sequence_SO=supercontig / SO=protein_coding / is_pseudo=false